MGSLDGEKMCSPLDILVQLKHHTYENYLKSDHWRSLKERYKASGLPQNCTVCGSKYVQMHHKTYARLGNEKLTDLEPLCDKHHKQRHDIARDRYKSKGGAKAAWADRPCEVCGKLVRVKVRKRHPECQQCRRARRYNCNGRPKPGRKRYDQLLREELARLG